MLSKKKISESNYDYANEDTNKTWCEKDLRTANSKDGVFKCNNILKVKIAKELKSIDVPVGKQNVVLNINNS